MLCSADESAYIGRVIRIQTFKPFPGSVFRPAQQILQNTPSRLRICFLQLLHCALGITVPLSSRISLHVTTCRLPARYPDTAVCTYLWSRMHFRISHFLRILIPTCTFLPSSAKDRRLAVQHAFVDFHCIVSPDLHIIEILAVRELVQDIF